MVLCILLLCCQIEFQTVHRKYWVSPRESLSLRFPGNTLETPVDSGLSIAAIKDKSSLWGHVPFSDASTLTVLVNFRPLVASVISDIARASIVLHIVYSRFRVRRVDRHSQPQSKGGWYTGNPQVRHHTVSGPGTLLNQCRLPCRVPGHEVVSARTNKRHHQVESQFCR